MHCDVIPVASGVAAILMPSYVAFQLWSILRMNLGGRSAGSFVTGIDLPRARSPKWLERWISKAFDKRDTAVLQVLRECLPRGSRILDVGCGEGRLLALLQKEGFEAYGIDLDIKMAKVAAESVGARWVVQGDFLECWGEAERMDAVLFCDSIRYVSRPQHLLKHALRVAPLVVVTEPFSFWHLLGRVLLLRFLYRPGHLVRANMETLVPSRRGRTFFHNIWLIERRRVLSLQGSLAALDEEIIKEDHWIEHQLMHPGLVEGIRRSILGAVATTLASAALLALYVCVC